MTMLMLGVIDGDDTDLDDRRHKWYIELWLSGYGIALVIPRSGINVEVTSQC